MGDNSGRLPEGEFRKNADRDAMGPDAPAPSPKGASEAPLPDQCDWAERDRRSQEKSQKS